VRHVQHNASGLSFTSRDCIDESLNTVLIDHTTLRSTWRKIRSQPRGVDPGGCGGPDPLKICKGVRVCFDPPENVTFFHSKLLLYNCKFHNVKDEHLDIITSLILLMLAMLPSYF